MEKEFIEFFGNYLSIGLNSGLIIGLIFGLLAGAWFIMTFEAFFDWLDRRRAKKKALSEEKEN